MAWPLGAVALYLLAIYGTAGYRALHPVGHSDQLSQAGAGMNSTIMMPMQHATSQVASNISCFQPQSIATPAASSGHHADFSQPVDVLLDTWLGTAAFNRLVGSAVLSFYHSIYIVCRCHQQRPKKLWRSRHRTGIPRHGSPGPGVLPSYAVVGSCVWGTLLCSSPCSVPAARLKTSSKATVSFAAAVSMAVMIAGAAGKETEGLLVMPGCPPWVPLQVLFSCACVGGGLPWLAAGCLGWRRPVDHLVGILSWASYTWQAQLEVLAVQAADKDRSDNHLKYGKLAEAKQVAKDLLIASTPHTVAVAI